MGEELSLLGSKVVGEMPMNESACFIFGNESIVCFELVNSRGGSDIMSVLKHMVTRQNKNDVKKKPPVLWYDIHNHKWLGPIPLLIYGWVDGGSLLSSIYVY